MEDYSSNDYFFDEKTNELVVHSTNFTTFSALRAKKVKSVIISGGGGNTGYVAPIIEWCKANDIPIFLYYGASAGVWYALSEYVTVSEHVVLEMHGMGSKSNSARASLHFLRTAEYVLEAGVKRGTFKQSKVDYLIKSWTKHLHGKKEEFWKDFHPVDMWYNMPEIVTK